MTNPTTDTIFSWNIDNLEIISNHDSLPDVVKSVHYTYTGTYENYTGQISGSVGLDPPDASNYTPYQDLTQEQVIGWLHTKYDIGVFNKNIIEQIQAQIPKPPVTTIFGLPWATITTDVSGGNTDISGGNTTTTDISGNTTTTDVSGNTTTTDRLGGGNTDVSVQL